MDFCNNMDMTKEELQMLDRLLAKLQMTTASEIEIHRTVKILLAQKEGKLQSSV